MSATFNQLMQISSDSNFKNRVNYCMIKAAIAVMAESSSTSSHQDRVNYSRKVLDGSANILEVAVAVLTNSTISAEAVLATTPDFAIPDSDIEFAVNSVFNAFSIR